MYLFIKIINKTINTITNYINKSILWCNINIVKFKIYKKYIHFNVYNILSWKISKVNKNQVCQLSSEIPLPLHPYHIVDQSPWPLALSGVLLSLTISAVLSFHGYIMGDLLLTCSFILLMWGMGLWFKDIISEASYLGFHTDKVQKGISLGVVLFIISEVFFFLSIFWAYFHSSLAPAIEIGGEWPPKGIEPVDASEVPTANTTILLSSGSAVTVSHHSLVNQLMDWANYGSIATIVLAILFTALQVLEYHGISYTITDSVFGSVFYMGTGLIWGSFVLILLLFYSKYEQKRNIYCFFTLTKNHLKRIRNENISPYWITGFSDGEASFVIRIGKRNKKSKGWKIAPIFSIELHIKDLLLLEKIQKYFSVGTIIRRKRYNRSTVIYSVQCVEDIKKKIIPHFLKYPLLTQKQEDFKLFCMAIDIILKKEHLVIEGLKKIISIRGSMNRKNVKSLNKYYGYIPPIKILFDNKSIIQDPYWLVGFVDAEGCFYVKPVKLKSKLRRFSLVFTISQHSRDLLLIKNILGYLKCGVIEIPKNRKEVRFIVYKFSDILEKIIPFFIKYNLLSVKRLDFLDYKKISCILKDKQILNEKDLIKIQSIKDKMNKNRLEFNI